MSVYRLEAVIKNYIWGGTRLREYYGKKGDEPLAESWELSFHPDGLTRTADESTLKDVLDEAALGANCTRFSNFPLLVKLIDAKQPLSVQVHPSDAYALENESSYGKTEMWYIVEADEGAGIYLGFARETDEEELRLAIADSCLEKFLNFVPVHAGECYFIPAGTVHAIGAGCLICEVQQNSNLTYRIYDYGRKDARGNPRELHVEKALSVMNRAPYVPLSDYLPVDGETTLGISRYFHAAEITLSGEHTVHVDSASFLALFCVAGEGIVQNEPVSRGDGLFITANSGDISLSGNATFITVSVRKYTLDASGASATLKDDLGRIHAKASDLDGEALLAKYALTKEDVEVC